MNDDSRALADLLRLLVDRVPAMLAYWDQGLTCRFANRAYQRWFGVDPEALIGTSLQDLLGPELFAKNEPFVRRALAGQEQAFERIVPGADGVERHSLASYLPHVVDGAVLGFVAMVNEVTELKHTEAQLRDLVAQLAAEVQRRRTVEEQLQQTQESLAVTLASIDAGFIATDLQGCVTTMNAVSERLTGWTAAQAVGQRLWTVFEREDRPAQTLSKSPVDVMREQGITVHDAHHVVVISRQGMRTPIEVKADLIRGPGGDARGVAMVMRDRTQQIKSEIDAGRLVAIVSGSQDAIIAKRLDGTIESWNASAEQMLGYTAAEAVGRSVLMLIPQDRQDEEMRIIAELARGSRVKPFETLRRRKDGQLIHVSLTISPIRDADGRVVGASKIVRDISDRVRSEETRALAHRLEAENLQIQEATRLKSQFLANMSHELRTPLNAIIGFAELIEAGRVAHDPAKLERFVGHIAASGRHLLQLINDVLDLSKVEAGKFEFFPERIDLDRLLHELCDIVRGSADGKRIRLTTQVDESLDEIRLDPVRLKQVLYNYLSNAIKFTPAGGHVTVRASVHGPLHWRLEVEDTGIGIAPTDMKRLFTEFQQIDAGYSKAHQGTGLGLALTKRLVEAQGGSVGVASTPGEGSVFHAILNRIHGTDQVMQVNQPSARDAASGRHLLVVEDDREVRARIMSGLAGAGFQISAAATGEQAAALAGQLPFDAITLDLRLPDLGGFSLLARLRERQSGLPSPVIGLTAPGGAGLVASFAIADVLAKPIRADEVGAIMARLRACTGDAKRVMVIDDDTTALDLMRATLTALGFEVLCFSGGRQALDAFDRADPHAIVLDLLMPGMDGFAVLAALQRMPRGRETPVYIWTSMTLSDQEYEQLQQSARDVVGKGEAGLPEMLRRLRQWCPGPRTDLTAA